MCIYSFHLNIFNLISWNIKVGERHLFSTEPLTFALYFPNLLFLFLLHLYLNSRFPVRGIVQVLLFHDLLVPFHKKEKLYDRNLRRDIIESNVFSFLNTSLQMEVSFVTFLFTRCTSRPPRNISKHTASFTSHVPCFHEV